MENEKQITIPYVAYESSNARWERLLKKIIIGWIITIIVAIIAIFAVDHGWRTFLEESDIEIYEYSQDGKGINIIGDSNGVDYNGATNESEKNNT